MLVTHPFHPISGRTLDVVEHLRVFGEERVFYLAPEGYRASIPAAWTSIALEAPGTDLGLGIQSSRFRVRDLLELTALVKEIRL